MTTPIRSNYKKLNNLRFSISKSICVLLILLISLQVKSQVSTGYIWSQSQQTYTAITSNAPSPAAVFPLSWDDDTTRYPLPFAFTYNGVSYPSGSGIIGIDTDGWIAFGTTGLVMTGTYGGGSWVTAGNTQGVYLNGSGNNNGVAGFNSDMEEQEFATFTGNVTNGSAVVTSISNFADLRVGVRLGGTGIVNGTVINSINVAAQTVTLSRTATATTSGDIITPLSSIYAYIRGVAPYRQLVIQWTRTTRFNTITGDDFSFQVVLNEGGGNPLYQTVQVVYGTLTTTKTAAQKAQVGLRGNSAADFNARATSSNWTATTAATSNTDLCQLTPAVFPPSGLTYTWSRPCPAKPSDAVAPISGIFAVCPNTTQVYSITGVPGAIAYTWTYTGANTTYSAITTLPSNTLVFATNATGGTLTVTPTNLCGSGAALSKTITINAITAATISYASAGFCISSAGTQAPALSGPAGGTYSSSPAGLTITSAGVITPSSSTAGSYTVTYTYNNGSCTGLVATTNVTIGAIPTVSVTATPAIICSGGSSQLQAAGEAPGNYTLTSIAYSSLTPAESPTSVFDGETPYSGVDTISSAIPLPFSFSYYGLPVSQLYVSENGYIQLQNAGTVSNVPQGMPNVVAPNNVVALAWADLVLDTLINPGANVRYFVNGTTPNQIFVIEYTGLSFAGSPNIGTVTGQIRLYESDNRIEVAIAAVNDGGNAIPKTTGIENSAGTLGVFATGHNSEVWNVSTPEAWKFQPKGVSYLWSPTTFLNNPAIQNPVAGAVTSSTTYSVKVTDASSGCFANASVAVTVGAPLNGVYTVGATGNYPTITAAIYAYNNLCITGPVTFLLIDNLYSTNETFPITINSNIYASAVKTLTIKPAATVAGSVSITGLNAKAIFKLYGADYVKIDGSKTAGGITKDLTITNTYTKKSGSVIWLSCASASSGATNDTIKNINFSGFSTLKTSYLIISSGTAITAVPATANANNAYINNSFIKAIKAIKLIGPAINESGALISGNSIGSATAASKINLSGIELSNQANCKVLDNTIFGITDATTVTASGISVLANASNIKIDGNSISDVKNTNATGYGANGIYLASTSNTANVSVTNNIIFDIAGTGYLGRSPEDNGYGMVVDGGAGYFIDFNTIVLNTNQTNSGYPAVLNIYSAGANAAVTIRDNILVNKQTQAGEHYVVEASVVKAKIGLIDYNDYYLTSGNMGYLGANLAGLPNITTGYGFNANSKNILPVFVSPTDYHLLPAGNPTLTNLGTPIAGITIDYDSTTRNGLTPDMGADEWLMPNTGSWVGKTSIDWLVPTNWETNKVPDGTTDVTVTGGYTFMPTIVTTQAVRGLALSAPGTPPLITLNLGVLQINGIITRTGGSIQGSNGTVEMNGTAAQSIPALLFTGNNLKNLVIGNSNSSGVTIGGALDIYRSLTFSSSGLKLTTGDVLTFKSTPTETAWLGNMTGKTISGNATVERYIPAGINHGKSWQLLAVPVSGTQSVKASWQENNLPLANSLPGYGTTISSEKPNAVARGFDFYTPIAGITGGPSMKIYNPLTNGYDGIDDGLPGTTTATIQIQNKKGYLLFVRGARSVQTSSATSVPTVLRTFGRLFTATTGETPPITTVLPNKFETIGNPYPSAIDFTAITRAAGVDAVFYVWDPLLPGSNLLGGYQTMSSVTGYKPTPGSTNYPAGVPITKIQSGQAFFVHGTAGGNVTFTEAAKVTGSQLVLRQQTNTPQQHLLSVDLYNMARPDYGAADGNIIAFSPAYQNEFENRDALKIMNTTENLGIVSNEKILAVEARKPVTKSDTIQYHISNLRSQSTYEFRFGPENLAMSNLQAFLGDRYLNNLIPVSLTDSTLIDFTITSDSTSYAANRFYLVFSEPDILPVTITRIAATRKGKKIIAVEWNVQNEIDIDRYMIMHGNDGRNFNTLLLKAPQLNTGAANNYLINDEDPYSSDNFYQVKAFNKNGTVQNSAIVKVAPLFTGEFISVYPNPLVNKVLGISFINQAPGLYHIRLTNKLGQVILNQSLLLTGNNFNQAIQLDRNIAAGNYQLTVISENGNRVTQEVVVN